MTSIHIVGKMESTQYNLHHIKLTQFAHSRPSLSLQANSEFLVIML
jgi:hypothetical protein